MWSQKSVLIRSLSICFYTTIPTSAIASSQESLFGSARVVFRPIMGTLSSGSFPASHPKPLTIYSSWFVLAAITLTTSLGSKKVLWPKSPMSPAEDRAPMNEQQREQAVKTVVDEFSDVKHVRGILSMGRYDDPDSGASSFSMLLGDTPHLDRQYAIFGKVTKGDETLRKLEELPTRREGIFVMVCFIKIPAGDTEMENCEHERSILKRRLAASAVEIERQRMKCFP